MSTRSKQNSSTMRAVRVAGVGFLILIFVISALPINDANTPLATPQNPAEVSSAHPFVPVGGTPVTVSGTYVHPTGIFSLPLVSGWELPGESPEESVAASPDQPITRAGATFINVNAASVVHTFVEDDPARNLISFEAMDAYYTADQVGAAWSQYNGGWREMNRRASDDSLIIDTEMTHEGLVYLGRQITRLQDRWLIVLRIVVPNNNPLLLERLQAVYAPQYHLWQTSLNAPLFWRTLSDTVSGYLIRYPADWRQEDGRHGAPYTLSGRLAERDYRLLTRAIPNRQATDEAAARAWVAETYPRAAIQTVQSEVRGAFTGYTLSFLAPDPDGNQRSLTATLINGKGALYVAVLQTFAEGRDLLAPNDNSISPELFRIRETFTPIRLAALTVLPTPTPTPAG